MLATKKYVGKAKTRPASRTPRRLMYAIRIDQARRDPDGAVSWASAGNTDVRAATPAATETATVRV